MRKCAALSRTTTAGSTVLTRVCGCFLGRDQYDVARECDPLCTRASIQRVTTCGANICLINGLDINVIDSTTGDININQQCGGCTVSSGCICYMNDVNVLAQNSRVGAITFDTAESCTISTCTTTDGIGIPCDEFFGALAENADPSGKSVQEKTTLWLYVMTPATWIALVMLMVLAGIYAFTR